MFYLHNLLLPAAAKEVTLNLRDNYAVVCGVNIPGQFVAPVPADVRYIVPGGLLGLPYLPYLGQAGSPPLVFTFDSAVSMVIVATESTLPPIVLASAVKLALLKDFEYLGQNGGTFEYRLTFDDESRVHVRGRVMNAREDEKSIYQGQSLPYILEHWGGEVLGE